MGTITAQSIITAARVDLLDPDGVNWLDADLLAMLNMAERAALALRPDLLNTRGPIPLVEGTLQELPIGGTVLMRLDENIGSSVRPTLVDSALLDTAMQDWPAGEASATVREYAVDPRDRRRFTVWPPNLGGGSVRGLFGIVPATTLLIGAAIHLEDQFDLALKHFVMGEAYAANTKRQDLTKATFYRGSFDKLLGMNAQSVAALTPRATNTGGA